VVGNLTGNLIEAELNPTELRGLSFGLDLLLYELPTSPGQGKLLQDTGSLRQNSAIHVSYPRRNWAGDEQGSATSFCYPTLTSSILPTKYSTLFVTSPLSSWVLFEYEYSTVQ